MAIDDPVRVGDVGTVIRLVVQDQDEAILDVSSASTKQIIFRKPSGATLTKVASFSTDGTDGRIQYATIAGDIDESGIWQMQGYVVTPTWTVRSWITSMNRFQGSSQQVSVPAYRYTGPID